MASKFWAATTDDHEHSLIAGIQADFGNRSAYGVYADWLDERDDARGEFVRVLEAAFFNDGDVQALPKIGDGQDVWANAIGANLLKGIEELQLRPAAQAVFKWVRPVVGIETERTDESKLPVGSSKFGGRPDMPPGLEWPSCSLGRMGFMGQIAFKEIAHSQSAGYFGLPYDGLLLLFVFQDFGDGIQPGVLARVGDEWKEVEGATQVIYVPGGETLERREPPDDLEDVEGNEILPSCKLNMADALDLPVSADTEDAALIAADEDWQISELRSKVKPSMHWLMGYPVHGRTDNTSPGKDWLTLMTLGSDDHLEWSWCDGEHLDLYIQQDSLKNHSFAETYGYAS